MKSKFYQHHNTILNRACTYQHVVNLPFLASKFYWLSSYSCHQRVDSSTNSFICPIGFIDKCPNFQTNVLQCSLILCVANTASQLQTTEPKYCIFSCFSLTTLLLRPSLFMDIQRQESLLLWTPFLQHSRSVMVKSVMVKLRNNHSQNTQHFRVRSLLSCLTKFKMISRFWLLLVTLVRQLLS